MTYIKKENRRIAFIILIYVNNIVIASLQGLKIISFKNALNKNFEITDHGELKYMFGIIITQNHANQLTYLK